MPCSGRGRSPAASSGTPRRAPTPLRRERAWQLLQLRIGLGAGLDPIPTLIGLRRHGATWEQIAEAAGVTRQAAHERWAPGVRAVMGG